MTIETTTAPVATNQIAVALDTNDWDTFVGWCELFGPRVGVLKVGLEAFMRWGPRSVEVAKRHSEEVFLDAKLHDIPNTVAGAVAGARALGVNYLTVHAGGGRAMLRAAADAAEGDVRLLGVTVLTHIDAAEMEALGLAGSPVDRVLRWAQLAAASGCAGAVCSPREVAAVRSRIPSPFLLVTPGVRPDGRSAGDDQRRTATPDRAISDGASLLVIGRPLTRAADPLAALEAIVS